MDIKTPTTYEEQIAKMRERGCTISNEDECLSFLTRVNYYRFSAYFLPYRLPDHTYIRGTSFTKVKSVYEFDQRMRMIVFAIVEELETSLRAKISHFHAHKYGALGYLSNENYDNKKHRHDIFTEQVNREIYRNRKAPFVKHHLERYGGAFPMWVIVELFSIGMLSHFYSDLKLEDKKILSAEYQTRANYLSSWLRCMTVLRNICAHYGRLYFLKFTNHPKMPSDEEYAITGRLFDQVYMLKLLYYSYKKWNNVYLAQMKALIDQYSGFINLNHIGFPDDWESRLIIV